MAKDLIPGTIPIKPGGGGTISAYEPSFLERHPIPTLGTATWEQVQNTLTLNMQKSIHTAIGYGISGRATIGAGDVAVKVFAKKAALTELKQKFTDPWGLTVTDISSLGQPLWKITDDYGNHQYINPEKEIEESYTKDLGEVFANFVGLNVTPEMQAAYDAARFIGSLKPIGKAIKAITGLKQGTQLSHRAIRALQIGLTGGITEAILDVESVINERKGDFEPLKALKTGAVFTLFGGVIEGAGAAKIAIADAYHLRHYFKSPEGIKALQTLSKSDLKYFINAKKAVNEGMSAARWNKRYSEQKLGDIFKKMKDSYMKADVTQPIVRLLPEKSGFNVKPVTDLTKTVAKSIASKNPYYSIPLARVKEDAAQGVTLAKEALARFAPEEALGHSTIMPMKAEQKGKIDSLISKHNLTPDAYNRLLLYSTGEINIDSLTVEQANTFIEHFNDFEVLAKDNKAVTKIMPVKIDINLPEGYNHKIRIKAGSDEVMNNVMLYSERLGGAPSNIEIPNLAQRQKSYAQDLETVAKIQRKHAKKVKVKEPTGKDVNRLNVWSSARYSIGQAEAKSGMPLRRAFSNIVAEGTGMNNANTSAIEEAIKTAGVKRIGAPNTFAEGKEISSWLFEEDEAMKLAIWQGMSDKVKALTSSAQDLMQGHAAYLTRWARFVKWDREAAKAQEQLNQAQIAGKKLTKKALEKIMAPVKKAKPPNAPATALTEGRNAKEINQFHDWLETQTWGTRKFYYMSQAEFKDLTELFPTGAIPEELEQQLTAVGKQPEIDLPATMTREGKRIAKGGSVFASIANHMNQVGTFAATYEDLTKFWTAFASTNPSVKDIQNVRNLINNVLGFHHSKGTAVKIGQFASRIFWKNQFAFLFHPMRSLWYGTRNIHQNLAYGLSQRPLKEVIKSYADFATGKLNPFMKEDYEKFWVSRISQRKQMQHQFLMQHQGTIVSDFGNQANAIIDLMGSVPIWSDEFNRLVAWPNLHQAAYRNTEQFARGKISYNKLKANLDIDTLHVTQRLELKKLLDKGDVRSFIANYSEYKVENIHGRYSTPLRSLAEQTPADRLLLGLMTFPRLTFEILYQNGAKPFVQGFQTGNYKQSYAGLKVIISTFIGAAAATWSLDKITGKKAYDIPETIARYAPLNPGVNKIKEMFDDVNQIIYYASENDKGIPEIAAAIVTSTLSNLELLIPFSDEGVAYYEAKEDKYGVTLYKLIRKQALKAYKNETGKDFREADRDYHERVHHLFWGGDERGEALKTKSKAPKIKDIFGGQKNIFN